MREFRGRPEDGNLGMAMLFERRARAQGASSAATEMRKNSGVKKSTFEREKRQNYLIKGFRTRKQNPKIRVTLNNNYDF